MGLLLFTIPVIFTISITLIILSAKSISNWKERKRRGEKPETWRIVSASVVLNTGILLFWVPISGVIGTVVMNFAFLLFFANAIY